MPQGASRGKAGTFLKTAAIVAIPVVTVGIVEGLHYGPSPSFPYLYGLGYLAIIATFTSTRVAAGSWVTTSFSALYLSVNGRDIPLAEDVLGFVFLLGLGGSIILVLKNRDALIARSRMDARRYRQILEMTSDLVYSVSGSGIIEWANDAFCNAVGVTRDEVVGRDVREFEISDSEWSGSPAGASGSNTMGVVRGRNGDRLEVEIVTVADPAQVGGNHVRFAHDVSAINRGQRLAAEGLRQVMTMIDLAPQAIILVADGKIVFCNANAANLFGGRQSQFVGRPVFDFIVPEQPEGRKAIEIVQEALEAATSGPSRSSRFEALSRRVGGEEFWASFELSGRAFPFSATPGVDAEFARSVLIQDMTSEIELREIRLRDATVAAQNESARNFLTTMTHELRSPLNGVLGAAQLLAESGLRNDQRELANGLEMSARGLLDVIEGILELRQVEESTEILRDTSFDVSQVIEGVVGSNLVGAERKGLALTALIDGDVPSQVTGDRGRFRQVIENLVSNAIKYTDEGVVSVSVGKAGEYSDRVELRISVADSGIGIAEEDLKTVFEPFMRVDSGLSGRGAGAGLGLAITKRLVEVLRGRLEVESEPGKGSTFTVTVPFAVGEPGAVLAPEGIEPSAAGWRTFSGRILVVDDSATNRLIATLQIEKLGLSAVAVESGTVALDLLEEESFDVALVDLRMPGMDGFEFARRIREQESSKGFPQMVLFAYTADTMAISSVVDEENFAAVLVKPVTIDSLESALKEHFVSTGDRHEDTT